MGNKLSHSFSPPYTVESLVAELNDWVSYEKRIGGARFMKTVRGRLHDGHPVTIKVFVRPDAGFSVEPYVRDANDELSRLQHLPNICPYHRILVHDKAVFLLRQYMLSNLYDRISTRPFLSFIEKKWIAFQLLSALSQAHSRQVYHGDIKSENVLVTSWNWTLLTDFASFKPTMLPEDNPTDFSFFFDISSRRTCYIAPERFVSDSVTQPTTTHLSSMSALPSHTNSTLLSTDDTTVPVLPIVPKTRYQGLTEAMDVFSMGCVLAELFLEGTIIFDLSELLRYKRNDYDPRPQLNSIGDPDIIEMISNMIQVDSQKRLSANDLLHKYRNRIFPVYFSSFLHNYILSVSESQLELLNMQAHYLGSPGHRRPSESDIRIQRVYHDFDKIAFSLNLSTVAINTSSCTTTCNRPALSTSTPDSVLAKKLDTSSFSAKDAALLLLNVLCANVRSLIYPSSKLFVLNLLHTLGTQVDDEHISDRVVPYVVFLLRDASAMVRASGISVLASLLSQIREILSVDVNMFSDYILPYLRPLVTDPEAIVRAAYAQNIATLAETAVRFVELNQIAQEEADDDSEWQVDSMGTQAFDVILSDLQERLQEHVTLLLTDSDVNVKRCLLSVITRLCIFFGKQKANDFLLSHMITYLNDRDPSLRSAFFDSMASVGAVIGDRSLADYILPLMMQSLSGMELDETVTERILSSLSVLGELGLLGKLKMREITAIVLPFIYSPNLCIRYAVISTLVSFTRQLSTTEAFCFLYPTIKPYLRQELYAMDELSFLESLDDPLDRHTFQMSVATIHQHKELQETFAKSSDTAIILQLLSKFINDSNSVRKLVSLSQLVLKLSQYTGSSSINPPKGIDEINLRDIKVTVNTVFLTPEVSTAGSEMSSKKKVSDHPLRLLRNQNYPTLSSQPTLSIKHASDSQLDRLKKNEAEGNQQSNNDSSMRRTSIGQSTDTAKPFRSRIPFDTLSLTERRRLSLRKGSSASLPSGLGFIKASPATSTVNATVTATMSGRQSTSGTDMTDYKSATVSLSPLNEPVSDLWSTTYDGYNSYLRALLQSLTQEAFPRMFSEFGTLQIKKHRAELQKGYVGDSRKWKLKGCLVAHLTEHRGAVTQICVSPDSNFFASCSEDGTVKIWDCQRLAKNVTNHSRLTYNRQGGCITCITFIKDTHCIASASDQGKIHIFKVQFLGEGKYGSCDLIHELRLDNEHALAIDHHSSEYNSLLIYSTNKSAVYGWDLRKDEQAFCLRNPLAFGYISAFVVDRNGCWLLVGTNRGTLVLWDMRFQVMVKYWGYPSKARIHRLVLHPTLKQTVVVMAGKREVSFWDLDTGECRLVFMVKEGKEQLLDSYKSLLPANPNDFVQNALRAFEEAPNTMGFQALVFPPEQSYFLVAGSTMKIHAWDLLKIERSLVIIGLDVDELQPKYSSTTVGQTTVYVESPQMRPVLKSTMRGNNGFSLVEPQMLVYHLDAILDMQLLTSPYYMLVTCGRDGAIKVWK